MQPETASPEPTTAAVSMRGKRWSHSTEYFILPMSCPASDRKISRGDIFMRPTQRQISAVTSGSAASAIAPQTFIFFA